MAGNKSGKDINANDGLGKSNNYPAHIQNALRVFNENPVRPNGFGGLAVLVEGPQSLLSALDQVAPDYEMDLNGTDLPTMMGVIVGARPEWFPPDSDWHSDAYGMIKMRLLEHDVRLDTMDFRAAVEWMKETDTRTIRVRDLRPVARRYQDASGGEVVANAEIFRAKNSRRGFLIRKDVGEGLTEEETAELARLEDEVGDYVNAIASLPFTEFESLGRQVQDELTTGRQETIKADLGAAPELLIPAAARR